MRLQRRMFGILLGGLIIAGLCSAVLAALRGPSDQHAEPLPDLGQLSDFSLVDHEERLFSPASLKDSIWVADFIFTRCAGQCPLMSAEMAKLQQAFEGLADLQLVSFSVDPAHDTPAVLAAYAKRYGALANRWRFVTGSYEAIAALARDSFRLAVSEEGTAQEPITHSLRFVLLDRRSHLRGYYDASDPEAMRRLQKDALRLLKDSSS